MDFEVCVTVTKKKKILFGQIACIIAILGFSFLLGLDLIADGLKVHGSHAPFIGFIVIFALLFILFVYFKRRPRIQITGQTITFYPLYRSAKQVAWSQITSRQVKSDFTGRKKIATNPGLGDEAMAYAATKNDSATLPASTEQIYTYFSGNTKLITISNKDFENAERFDRMVLDHLADRAEKNAENTVISDIKPALQTRKSAVAAAACILVAVTILLIFALPVLQHLSGLKAKSYTSGNITFHIDPAWSPIDGYDGSFFDHTKGIAYQINGVSALSPYTPESFYDELIDFYKQDYDPVISEPLTYSTRKDGTEQYMANIKMAKDDIYYIYTTVMILPEQDTVITFSAQAALQSAAAHEKEIITAVEHMALSAVCADEPKQTKPASENILAGTSWIADNDGSQWVFEKDSSFHWYQKKGITDDNYYAGTYEFYMGADAMKYLTEDLSDYGVTEEELLEVIHRNSEYTLDRLVCFTATNQSFMLDGQEQLSKPAMTHYFGFLLMDGTYLDIANMNTGSYYGFTKE